MTNSESPNRSSLTQRGITAAYWGLLGTVLRTMLQFAAQIALARLLGPQQYGLFAIGYVVVSFSSLLGDIGVAYGLIQKKELTNEDIRFVFTCQLLLGTLSALVVYVFAGSIAMLFHEPHAVPVIQQLAVVCLIGALTAPSLNLLKRSLDFKSLNLYSIISYFIGYIGVGIPLALAGAKVSALVAAVLTQAVLNLALLYRKTRHPLRLLFWHGDAVSQLHYGMTVFFTNITNWMIGNIDRAVVGRVFGSSTVGLYATAYNLVSTPMMALISAMQGALFSTTSRAQDDVSRLRSAFTSLLGLVPLVVFPIFFGVAAASETVIYSIYGPAWRDAGALLRPLALAMPFNILVALATPILWTSGRVTKEVSVNLPFAIIGAVTAYVAAMISAEAVAWTVSALLVLRTGFILGFAVRAVRLESKKLMHATMSTLGVSLVVFIAVLLTDAFARGVTNLPLVWLMTDIGSGTLALIGALVLFRRLISPDAAALTMQVASRAPPYLQKAMARYFERAKL